MFENPHGRLVLFFFVVTAGADHAVKAGIIAPTAYEEDHGFNNAMFFIALAEIVDVDHHVSVGGEGVPCQIERLKKKMNHPFVEC